MKCFLALLFVAAKIQAGVNWNTFDAKPEDDLKVLDDAKKYNYVYCEVTLGPPGQASTDQGTGQPEGTVDQKLVNQPEVTVQENPNKDQNDVEDKTGNKNTPAEGEVNNNDKKNMRLRRRLLAGEKFKHDVNCYFYSGPEKKVSVNESKTCDKEELVVESPKKFRKVFKYEAQKTYFMLYELPPSGKNKVIVEPCNVKIMGVDILAAFASLLTLAYLF